VASSGNTNQEINTELDELKTAFTANSFGDPVALSQSSTALAAWCRGVENRLAAMEFTPVQMRETLRAIADQATSQPQDYDTARQLLGAWIVVYGELIQQQPAPLSEQQQLAVSDLLAKADNAWPELTQGRPFVKTCETAPPEAPMDYAKLLKQHFCDRAAFDPQQFGQLMSGLAEAIGEQ
jgi:hypothetical protein